MHLPLLLSVSGERQVQPVAAGFSPREQERGGVGVGVAVCGVGAVVVVVVVEPPLSETRSGDGAV